MIDFLCKEIAGNKRKHSREKKYMDNKTTQKQQRNKEYSEATTLTKRLFKSICEVWAVQIPNKWK